MSPDQIDSIESGKSSTIESNFFKGMPVIWTGTGTAILEEGLEDAFVSCYAKVFKSWADPTSRIPDAAGVHQAKRRYLQTQGTFSDKMIVSLMIGHGNIDPINNTNVYGFAISDRFTQDHRSSIRAITTSICHVYPELTTVSDTISTSLFEQVQAGYMDESQLLFYDLGVDSRALRREYGRLNLPGFIAKQYYRAYTLKFMTTHLAQPRGSNIHDGRETNDRMLFWTTQRSPLFRIALDRQEFRQVLAATPNTTSDDRPYVGIFEVGINDLNRILASPSIYYQSINRKDDNRFVTIPY